MVAFDRGRDLRCPRSPPLSAGCSLRSTSVCSARLADHRCVSMALLARALGATERTFANRWRRVRHPQEHGSSQETSTSTSTHTTCAVDDRSARELVMDTAIAEGTQHAFRRWLQNSMHALRMRSARITLRRNYQSHPLSPSPGAPSSGRTSGMERISSEDACKI